MLTRTSVLTLMVTLTTLQLVSAKLSDYITPCSVKDPKLGECIVERAQQMIPHFVKGVKELDVPPIDPMLISHLQIQQESSISFNLTNTTQNGWKDIRFTHAKFDPQTLNLDFDYFLPINEFKGNYVLRGRLLIPIGGSGPCSIVSHNVTVHVAIKGKMATRDGKRYFEIIDLKSKVTMKRIQIQLDNLFGNKEISKQINTFLNANNDDILEILDPAMGGITQEIIEVILGNMFKKVPLDELFTDMDDTKP